MATARPLRDVFGELAGGTASDEPAGEEPAGSPGAEPAELLAAHGHADLPADLVAEAVVNFADTAPVEVAEHLAAFVRAHSGVPDAGDTTDAGDWFELLTTVPAGAGPEWAEVAEADPALEDPFDLDFGGGAPEQTAASALDPAEESLWPDDIGPTAPGGTAERVSDSAVEGEPDFIAESEPAAAQTHTGPADAGEPDEPADDGDPGQGIDDLDG
ncbi:MAG TPA: hypothetical protein VHI50_10760 [Micromonosporaceae bacterium]|nr:hypothetical protein [Micromonosporaceae bacterium]